MVGFSLILSLDLVARGIDTGMLVVSVGKAGLGTGS